MKATLQLSGGEAPHAFHLEEGSTTIGRADTNVIVLNHVNVSRNHLEIRVDTAGAQIADLNSVNGTSVNDVKLTPGAWQPLHPGDRIRLGPFNLSFDHEPEDDATVVISRSALIPPPAVPVNTPAPPPVPAIEPREPLAPIPQPVASLPGPQPVVLGVPAPAKAPEPLVTPPPVQLEPSPVESEPADTARRSVERSTVAATSREKVALLLLAIALALSLPASFAAWNQRVLLNQERFVSLGNDVLSKPAVQRELALQLSREIDRSNTNLLKELGIPAEVEQITTDILDSIFGGSSSSSSSSTTKGSTGGDSFLDAIMLDTIQALPNTPVADSALVSTHGALKTAIRDSSVTTSNDVIALDIGDGMGQLFGFAGIAGITSDELGGDFGRIEITQNADTVRALKLMRFFDGKAVLLVVLVVVALGAGIYFADDRIRYTKLACLALIGSSLLWIVVVLGPVRSWVLGDVGDSESARAAVSATYGVIAGSYVQQELIVIGVGVVVLAVGLIQSSKAATAKQP